MVKLNILKALEKKGNKPEDYVDDVLGNPNLIPLILEGTSSTKARVKFGCAKMLRIISEKNPQVLYPQMDFFINHLDNNNNIIKWIAMDVVANLTKVDIKNKFDDIFNQYYDFLSDDVMITAGHVVDNSGVIAKAKPYLRDEITNNLLNVENIPRNQECKNILLGKAILSFGRYFDQIENKEEVISFVKRQLDNSRPATKKKAEKFLKRFGKET